MEILKLLSEKVAYHKQRSHRIEALIDGVFAIVMTLLVLDIRPPVGEIKIEDGVGSLLVHTFPKILTFVLSFSITGMFWLIFINQFNYIHTSDRQENIIVLFYLLFVSLIPFSTSFLSEHLGSRVATGFYIFNLLCIYLMNILHWLYSYHLGLVHVEGSDTLSVHKAILRRSNLALIAHVITAGCCFFSSSLALYLTIFLQVIFTFSGFLERLNQGRRNKPLQPIP